MQRVVLACLTLLLGLVPLAASDAPGSAGPALASRRVLDEGLYAWSTAELRSGRLVPDPGEALATEFEWKRQGPTPDGEGRWRWAHEVSLVEKRGSGTVLARRTVAYDSQTGDEFARTETTAATRVVSAAVVDRTLATQGIVEERTTYRSGGPAPCGVAGLIEPEPGTIGTRRCSLPDRVLEPTVVRGLGAAAETHAHVYASSEGSSPRVFLWLSPGIPYPIRLAVERPEGGFDVAQLLSFISGTEPLQVGPMGGTSSLTAVPRTPWTVDEGGTEPVFPLSEAYAWARDGSPDPSFRRFLESHPAAYLESARFETRLSQGLDEHGWDLLLAADGDRLAVRVLRTRSPLAPELPPLLRIEPGSVSAHGIDLAAPTIDGDGLPNALPSIASVQRRWDANGLEPRLGLTPQWGFRLQCELGCADIALAVWAETPGVVRPHGQFTGWADPAPTTARMVVVDGAVVATERSSPPPDPAAGASGSWTGAPDARVDAALLPFGGTFFVPWTPNPVGLGAALTLGVIVAGWTGWIAHRVLGGRPR